MLDCIEQPLDSSTSIVMGVTDGAISLPGGVLDDKKNCYRKVRLRELTGHDEEVLLSQRFESSSEQVTQFLYGAIEAIEGCEQAISTELLDNMLVGDRDYLLLRLRQLNIGDHVHQIMRCPQNDCGKKVDVDFDISDLPLNVAHIVQPAVEIRLQKMVYQDDPASDEMLVRLPTGSDIAELIKRGASNAAQANSILFSRIVQRIGSQQGLSIEQAHALPLWLRNVLTDYLDENAPGPDLRIEIQCPHCKQEMNYTFDIHSFFLPNGK